MLKIGSKRRRTKKEIEDEKQEKLLKEQMVAEKMAQFEEMSKKIELLSKDNENNKAAAQILSDMLSKGDCIQQPDGSIVMSASPSKRKYDESDD